MRQRCEKCGVVSRVKPRERRCKIVADRGLFWCYGHLVTVKAVKRTVSLEEKLGHAHDGLAEAITRLKRATTAIGRWQRKIKQVERRLDDLDHPRPPKPRAKRVPATRGIRLRDEAVA
jgi:hypothetical protein